MNSEALLVDIRFVSEFIYKGCEKINDRKTLITNMEEPVRMTIYVSEKQDKILVSVEGSC